MKKLIVNADGFGFTQGINRGILETVKEGIVTSTSCNVNFPYIQEVVELKKLKPQMSIGLHLNVNVGRPVLPIKEVPSLVNKNGEFWGNEFANRFFKRKINLKDIEKELDAQIQKLQELGIEISHLDGHQNKHLYPGYFEIVLKLGEKYNIKRIRCHRRYMFVNNVEHRRGKIFYYYLKHPKRIISHGFARLQMFRAEKKGFKMADRLITPAYADNSFKYSKSTWINIIKNLPEGVNEIYCHPGYADDELRKYAKYVDEREDEIIIMKDIDLIKQIEKENIELISFNEV